MAVCGYFGKIPGAGDFLFRGLPAHLSEAWAEHMAGWIGAGRSAAASGWTKRFLTSPVWRFAIAPGVLGKDGWVGLLAGSVDSVGREFPFTVMVGADIDPAAVQPVGWLDPRLDAVEERMLAVMEGSEDTARLMTALREVAASAARGLDGQAIAEPAKRLILPRNGDDAICLSDMAESGQNERATRHAYSWPASRNDSRHDRLCMWWHDGTGNRPADFCVSRGIPSGQSVLPFFLGDWESHGWRRHGAAACPTP